MELQIITSLVFCVLGKSVHMAGPAVIRAALMAVGWPGYDSLL